MSIKVVTHDEMVDITNVCKKLVDKNHKISCLIGNFLGEGKTLTLKNLRGNSLYNSLIKVLIHESKRIS